MENDRQMYSGENIPPKPETSLPAYQVVIELAAVTMACALIPRLVSLTAEEMGEIITTLRSDPTNHSSNHLRDIGSAAMGIGLIINFAAVGAMGIHGFYQEQIAPRLDRRKTSHNLMDQNLSNSSFEEML